MSSRHRGPRRWLVVVLSVAAGLALVAVLAVHALQPAVEATTETAFGTLVPSLQDVVGEPVTVGTRITVQEPGSVSAIRFYRSPRSGGHQEGAIFSEHGEQLARVGLPDGGDPGWRTAKLRTPLAVAAGTTLTVAVFVPDGAYAASNDFAWPTANPFLAATQGLYRYGSTLAMPSSSYRSTSYFVDLAFVPGSPVVSSRSASAASASSAPDPDDPTLLDLPRIPWDGGPAYWAQFRKAREAGWADPSFFPVGVWWSGVSSDAEVQFDKQLGLNFYTQLNPATDYRLIERNGMFWVGGPSLQHLSESSPGWVGSFLDDEVDGRFEPASAGFTYLEKLSDPIPPDKTGRFRYTNYTSSVVSHDRAAADAERYVNDFAEVVSVDQYFYSVPQCDWTENWARYIVEVPKATCRTAHSYGLMMDALAERDRADGKLQPLFNFVENASPYGSTNGFHDVHGDQIQGAVMSSLIHEARGIMWFNQQFAGSCQSGNYFRRAEHEPKGCAAENTAAAKKINLLIKSLAPVLNTQSYRWDFGPELDTMLKVKDDQAYVFAMTTGTNGSRTFTLPAGVHGVRAEVVGEDRSVPIEGGRFSDEFRSESSYHVYKIGVGN